ncbi:MAG TPA: hypothetical protein VFS43_35280 [Polyangiaceae bacterium]|nr:hypothetical protein [Polyangiaceae bacterium]
MNLPPRAPSLLCTTLAALATVAGAGCDAAASRAAPVLGAPALGAVERGEGSPSLAPAEDELRGPPGEGAPGPARPGAAPPAGGALDPTFGAGGLVRLDLMPPFGGLGAIVVGDGGAISVVGGDYGLVARLLENGAPDPSFGFGGVAVPGPAGFYVSAAALQPDGRLVISGADLTATTPRRVLVRRLNADGTPDPSFGEGGLAGIHLGRDGWANVTDLALQGDRLVAVGHGEHPDRPGPAAFALRLGPDGSLDRSFHDPDGFLAYSAPGSAQGVAPGDEFVSLLVRPDGSLFAAGTGQNLALPPGEQSPDFLLYHLSPDGQPDATFGDAGALYLAPSPGPGPLEEHCAKLGATRDGRLVLGGTSYALGASALVLARRLPDGQPDPSFGEGGTFVLEGGARLEDLVVLPDDSVVAVGNLGAAGASVAVALHVLPDGRLDPAFGEGGVVRFEPFVGASAHLIARQPDGKLVVGGSGFDGTFVRFLARLADPTACAAGARAPADGGSLPGRLRRGRPGVAPADRRAQRAEGGPAPRERVHGAGVRQKVHR